MKLPVKKAVLACAFIIGLALVFVVWKQQQTELKNEALESKENKLAPYEFFEMARNYPDFEMNIQAFNTALAQCYQEMRAKAKTLNFGDSWKQEGPNNIGGRINCIAVHPTNNSIILAGSVFGGIFKSSDQGITWKPVFDSTAYLAIASIVYDVTNPNIVYAGTGDPSTAFTAFTGNGIYKSIDGGETWKYLGLKETGIVSKITIDPSDNKIMYAATMGFLMRRDNNKGLYKTIDGGLTWRNILFVDNETGVMDVLINPTTPAILYATTMRRIRTHQETITSGNATAIYKSIDGGNTWAKIITGLPPAPWCKVNIDMHPTQPNTLLASIVNSSWQLEGIFTSTNGGNNWTALNTSSIDENALGGFGWYFGEVRFNQFNTNEIFLQGVDLWKSTNGGNSWSYGAPEWYKYIVHADKHYLHFFSATNYLLATDGGVYQTKDAGNNWVKLSNFPITQFYRVKVNYWEDGTYYGGAQDQGTSKGNASDPNNWTRVLGGDGFRTDFSNDDPLIMYASTQNGRIFYSTFGGINFQLATSGVDATDRKNWDSPYLLSRHNKSVYLGTQFVYRADDYSLPLFDKISPDLTDGNIFGSQFHTISTLFQNNLTKDKLYAGTSDANVWRSIDEGRNWQNITAILPNKYVTSITGSFINEDVIYVSHSGYRSDAYLPHIHRSKNNGDTWEDISGNLPQFAINDVLTFSKNDSIIAVATDGGVYMTMDAGTSWERMGNNMPVFPVFDIDYDSVNAKLIAGTFARSMMSYDLSNIFKKDSIPIGLNEELFLSEMNIYPIPAKTSVTINLPSQYLYERIAIVNTNGQRMHAANRPSNKEQIEIDNWNNGVYFILVYVEGMKSPIVKKMVKTSD